jgi:hypothetical protein
VSWLPVAEWATLFKIWPIVCYRFVEYITYRFVMYLFSFDAHDSQVLSFDGVTDFLGLPVMTLDCFV